MPRALSARRGRVVRAQAQERPCGAHHPWSCPARRDELAPGVEARRGPRAPAPKLSGEDQLVLPHFALISRDYGSQSTLNSSADCARTACDYQAVRSQ